MGAKKKGVAKKVAGKVKGALGIKSKGRKGRRHGASYWANKVLVEKLKKRYNRLKYGGMR